MSQIKVPLMGVWARQEFIQSRADLNLYNGTVAPAGVHCSFCPREIMDHEINVVEYGTKQACRHCFKARYKNIRQKYKHMTVPEDLGVVIDAKLPTIEQALAEGVSEQDKLIAELKSKAGLTDK